MFQRFLKTFNNNNWNDFANKVLEKDKFITVHSLLINKYYRKR